MDFNDTLETVTFATVSNLSSPIYRMPPGSSGSNEAVKMAVIKFIYSYVLIVQIVFGCSGNALNLAVLLSKKMRNSRTNLLFAGMALADLCYLLMNIPNFLFVQGVLQNSIWYRSHHQILIGTINFFSALSIWFMLYATIERVHVLRNPFRAVARRQASMRFAFEIAAVALLSFAVTYVQFLPKPTSQEGVPWWHSVLVVVHVFTVIVLPCVLSSLLNLLLIIALKQNDFPGKLAADVSSNRALMATRSRNEKKVTFMVVVILTSFVVCNAPGAVLSILQSFSLQPDNIFTVRLLQTISNSLATTGKVLNFVLFCSSSHHFRRLLLDRIKELRRCVVGGGRRVGVRVGRGSRRNRSVSYGFNSSRRSASKTLSIPMQSPKEQHETQKQELHAHQQDSLVQPTAI